MIKLLSDGNDRTVDELADILETTRRTVYRILDEIEACDYVINRNHGHPKILKYNPSLEELGSMVNFTVEEQALLQQMVLGSDNNPLRQSLLAKLQMMMDNSVVMPKLTSEKGAERKVRIINLAIKKRQQAVLIHYDSGSSNTFQDRNVEPVAWSENFRQLHAFDIDKQVMRCFLVSRMKDVRLLEQSWQYEHLHKVPKIDCFWMTGEDLEEVTLSLSRLALNLLHEEYPLSRNCKSWKYSDPERPYRIRMTICNPRGAARFVMGLGRQCQVVKGEKLMAYIESMK